MPSIVKMIQAYRALEQFDRAAHKTPASERSQRLRGLLMDLRARDRVKDRAEAAKPKKRHVA